MGQSESEQGERAFFYLIGLSIVLATIATLVTAALTYWYIAIPLLIGLCVLVYFQMRARRERRRREAAALRVEMFKARDRMVARNGLRYPFLVADALDALASGQRPTFAMLETTLNLPKRAARDIMNDLEHLGFVNRELNGKRRTTAASSGRLREASTALRDASPPLPSEFRD